MKIDPIKAMRIAAIAITAAAAIPLYQGFNEMPLILMCLACMACACVVLPSGLQSPEIGVQAVSAAIYSGLLLFFGLFAAFQIWRTMTAIFIWLDAVLLKFFNLF